MTVHARALLSSNDGTGTQEIQVQAGTYDGVYSRAEEAVEDGWTLVSVQVTAE